MPECYGILDAFPVLPWENNIPVSINCVCMNHEAFSNWCLKWVVDSTCHTFSKETLSCVHQKKHYYQWLFHSHNIASYNKIPPSVDLPSIWSFPCLIVKDFTFTLMLWSWCGQGTRKGLTSVLFNQLIHFKRWLNWSIEFVTYFVYIKTSISFLI